MTVLGLDPGTRKCGYAILTGPADRPLVLGIVPTENLAERLREVIAAYPVSDVVRSLGITVELVDERETTLKARARFFSDHPPRGWRRLLPRGMLLPDRPIDDYAALLIGERYLKGS